MPDTWICFMTKFSRYIQNNFHFKIWQLVNKIPSYSYFHLFNKFYFNQDMSRPTVHIVIVKHFQDEPSVPMECISPLSMLAFRRFDMAWTVQLRRADRLEVLLFLLGSMAVSCSSSEQSFSRFMNSVKYLKQRKTFTDLLWLHLDTVL